MRKGVRCDATVTCKRLDPVRRKLNTVNKGELLFMLLRDAGCSKEKALRFLTRIRCKFDMTMLRDGPDGYRILKPQIDPIFS